MAKPQGSPSKQEIEKKKLQKRKEKEQRREERRAAAKEGKSLDDMIAYVDEDGNITNTPPDPGKKKTVNTEDIVIGAKARDDEKEPAGRTGTITFFNTSKGYGFIRDDQSRDSVFVHINALSEPVKENDKVSF
ncbi:MAG TPA: cold shock domain-containing protein, partial [Chryseosolibacter sp.]|nr:cold shock domain-containing protein [Chryseosolibacter sp.]